MAIDVARVLPEEIGRGIIVDEGLDSAGREEGLAEPNEAVIRGDLDP